MERGGFHQTNPLRTYAFSIALILLSFLPVSSSQAESVHRVEKWHGWWELGGYLGTDDSSRGDVTIFAPLAQSARSLFFSELRGKFFEQNNKEGNFALAYRQMLPSGWNLGVWGGLDVRNTLSNNAFWQVSGGVEALNWRWDLRANGYLPLNDERNVTANDTTVFGAPAVGLSGNQISLITPVITTTFMDKELALWGADGEIGFLVFSGKTTDLDFWPELRVFGGGFWFDHVDLPNEVAGPKGRIELRIENVISSMPGSRFTLESEFSYDKMREDRWEFGGRLRIPFGGTSNEPASIYSSYSTLTAQERRMTESIKRDTDIVISGMSESVATRTEYINETVIDEATDVALNRVAFARTTDDLVTAIASGGNTLIIVQGAATPINVSAGQAALQENQTLQGGASTILLRGANTGAVVPFTAPGARPTLLSTDRDFFTGIVTMATNTHAAGINVQGNIPSGIDNNGFFGQNIANVVVEQATISDTGGMGIFFTGANSTVTISNNTISNTGFDGVHFLHSSNINIMLSENYISDVSGGGVIFNAGNSDVTLANNTISNTETGVVFGGGNSGVTLSHNNIFNSRDRGIAFGRANTNVTLNSNNILNTNATGVSFGSTNSNLVVTNNTVSNTEGAAGMLFDSDNSDVITIGNAISNIGGPGLFFDSGAQNLTVSDNTISDTQSEGVRLGGGENITVTGNLISNTGSDGVAIRGNTDLTLSENVFAMIGDDVFDFQGASYKIVRPVSNNNVTTDAPAGHLCQGAASIFTGTLEVVDQNGVLQTFSNGC